MVLVHVTNNTQFPSSSHPTCLILYYTELSTMELMTWIRLASSFPQLTFLCSKVDSQPEIRVYRKNELVTHYPSNTPFDQLEDIALLLSTGTDVELTHDYMCA